MNDDLESDDEGRKGEMARQRVKLGHALFALTAVRAYRWSLAHKPGFGPFCVYLKVGSCAALYACQPYFELDLSPVPSKLQH